MASFCESVTVAAPPRVVLNVLAPTSASPEGSVEGGQPCRPRWARSHKVNFVPECALRSRQGKRRPRLLYGELCFCEYWRFRVAFTSISMKQTQQQL